MIRYSVQITNITNNYHYENVIHHYIFTYFDFLMYLIMLANVIHYNNVNCLFTKCY